MNTDLYWMALAYEAARNSNCGKRHVGAVIVKAGRRIAYGANTTKGFCDPCNRKNCSAVHAEIIALNQVSGGPAPGAVMYVTYQPCLNCAKAIKDAGIVKVVYDQINSDFSGINFLRFAGVELEHISTEWDKDVENIQNMEVQT
jgi:dCMP deaminase